ncbi:MAG TPA: endo-1,4-beta-xylanase [Sedimentisphaerales bacterium]|nr:endo-1,4-beta-xylanase [Sedimentisphaerales bacterium]
MEFEVFKNSKIVDDFALRGAYMFGTDGIATRRSQIVFKDGIIKCTKPNLETAGLALLWPVDGFGSVLLPTTCLPERAQRYSLNVELARAKLMQIVTKQEDWAFFDNVGDLEGSVREARDLFIRAIQNISDAPLASRLADESLEKATVFSERLAIKQAESSLSERGRSRGFSRGCLGCQVNPVELTNAKYGEHLLDLFGFVTVPVKWSQIESHRGNYDYSVVDACVSTLARKRLAVCAGPLLCFSQEHLPDWLVRSGAGFEKIREMAYKFVLRTVARYSGSIHAWRVISGLNVFNHFGFSFEQILEMTRMASMAVKQRSDRSLKIVEISNPWGEYYAVATNTIPPLVYIDMVVQSGISFDAFGLQIRMGKDEPGMHVRDMMQVSAVLDYFGGVGKPLYITELEVPGENGSGSQVSQEAGLRHRKWDQLWQAQWLEQFYKIALSKPFVEAVTYCHLTDAKDSVLPNSGLLTEQGEPKKSFLTLQELQGHIFGR